MWLRDPFYTLRGEADFVGFEISQGEISGEAALGGIWKPRGKAGERAVPSA
jgi:hypothetical protein